MPPINPTNLKRLRDSKRWTLDDLARASKVDRGTISRIETRKQAGRKQATIARLADALGTDIDTLTGPDLAEETKAETTAPKSQMKVRIADDARNALALVSRRYAVNEAHIIHLAPLLFLWAAEASLKQRRQRLEALAEQWDSMKSESGFCHLHGSLTDNWRGYEVMEEERRSIANRDIFALRIDDDARHVDYEESEQNPMAMFLKELTDSLDGLAEFEHWSPVWDRPGYTLGQEEASALVGGDEKATRHIVNGYAPLHELPKDVRESGPQAVARWASETGDAALRDFFGADFDLLLEDI